MVKWEPVFEELTEALEEVRKKRGYKPTTRLRLKILLSNDNGFMYKTTLESVQSVLWKLTEEHGDTIVKFAVESTHGTVLFFRSLYHTKQGEGSGGDDVSVEKFGKLSADAKAIRSKVLEAQIRDRLLWLDKQQETK